MSYEFSPRGGGGRGRGGRRGGYGMGPGADTAHLRAADRLQRLPGPLTAQKLDGGDPFLRERIIKIGDERPSVLEGAVLALAEDVERAIGEGEADWVIKILLKCVSKLGSKIPVYGTLVGLVNVDVPDFGRKMINAVHERLEEAATNDDFLTQKLLLRMSAELCNSGVLYQSGLLGLLHDYLAVCADANAHQRRRDLCAWLVMATLPYCCERLRQDKREQLEDLHSTLHDYVKKRPPVKHLYDGALEIFQAYPPLKKSAAMDEVEEAWAMVTELVETRWLRPECLITSLNDTSGPGGQGPGRIVSRLRRCPSQHQMPTLRLEKTDSRPKGVKRISLVFRLLPTLREVALPAIWITQDNVRDILLFFAGDRKLFPKELVDQPGVGGLKGNIHEGAKQMLNLPNVPKFEGAVVEAIVGELLRLPTPAHPTVYYGCMLIELCKLQSTVHPALGAAINYLFEKLPVMQAECADRFADWLSFHFSNLDFKWLWRDWLKVLEQPCWALQRRWVAKTLDRCLRLSYYQRMTSVLKNDDAEPLASLMREDQSAVFPMAADGHPLKELAVELCDMVSLARRLDCEALQQFVSSQLSNLPGEQPTADRAKMLISAMVYEGRESFSHVLGILGRYLPVLRACVESEADQYAAAAAVHEVWERSPAMSVVVLDKLVAMKLVAPLNLVRWLLGDYEACKLRADFAWELLISAINKPVALVKTVRQDLAAAQKELEVLKEKLGEGDHPELQEKTERISRIKAVLRTSLRDQDDIIVCAIRHLIELANENFERRGGVVALRKPKRLRRRVDEDDSEDDSQKSSDESSDDDLETRSNKSGSSIGGSNSSDDDKPPAKRKPRRREKSSEKVRKAKHQTSPATAGVPDAAKDLTADDGVAAKESDKSGEANAANENGSASANDDAMPLDSAAAEKGEKSRKDEGRAMEVDMQSQDKNRKANVGISEHAAEKDDEETVWMRTIRGRLMQVARTFAAQIYECHEMLEDEIMPIRIQDPHLRRLVASVQRIR